MPQYQYFWWLPGFARIARPGYLHPWSAPTRAVKAGRRPPEGEALTARSAGAATMDWEARQGVLLAGRPRHPGPPPQPIAAVARPLRRRGSRSALEADVGCSCRRDPAPACDLGRSGRAKRSRGTGFGRGSSRIPRRIPPRYESRPDRIRSVLHNRPERERNQGQNQPCNDPRPDPRPRRQPHPSHPHELFDHRGAVPTPAHQGAPNSSPLAAHGWGPTQRRGVPESRPDTATRASLRTPGPA